MRKFFAHTALAVAAFAGISSVAEARLFVQIRDQTGVAVSLTCDSGLAQSGTNCTGFDAYALGANNLNFTGSVGDFSFLNTSFSANPPGSTFGSFSAANNLRFTSSAANQQLLIDMTAFDFSSPSGRFKNIVGTSSQNSYFGGNDGSNQLYGFFVDGANGTSSATGVACATSPLLVSNGGCNVSGLVDIGAPGTQLFSLKQTQLINVVAAGQQIQNSSSLTVTVPEPASLALVGLALVGAGFASRRVKA